MTKHPFIVAGWVIGCFVSVWFLEFSGIFVLRIVGWLWISGAISYAGLVTLAIDLHKDS